ncbi:MAG: HEAT repeat domain-containing protein [Leptolyngbyaceae cyanobacterium SM1_3_5]|nr:HEAT repeat domain-containing protein [Leptolyngbyaceae cyanobacterium SM1_3_5]
MEDPDSSMRASAAYVLGDLATRTQGTDRQEIMAILMRLSQDVDPQVRVQAANALGGLGSPAMGE